MVTTKELDVTGSAADEGNKRHGDYETMRLRDYETTRYGGDGKRLYNERNNHRRTTMSPSRSYRRDSRNYLIPVVH